METAFAGQAIGRPILGTPDTVRSFDGEAIRAFMARAYAPGRMVFAAAGPLEHEAIVEGVARHFGDIEPIEPPPAEPGRYTGGERRRLRKLEQANVMLGFPGVSFKDPTYYATHLFAQVLGGGLTSRLWHEVRETLGLAYGVDAFHWPFSDCGLFGIGAGTAAKDLVQLLEVSLECARAAAREADAVEIRRAKAQLKVALLASLETPGGRVERSARQILAWDRVIPGDEIARRVDAVTVDEDQGGGRGPAPRRADARGHRPDPTAARPRRRGGAPGGLSARPFFRRKPPPSTPETRARGAVARPLVALALSCTRTAGTSCTAPLHRSADERSTRCAPSPSSWPPFWRCSRSPHRRRWPSRRCASPWRRRRST
jgi:hypothetical protein